LKRTGGYEEEMDAAAVKRRGAGCEGVAAVKRM
jgi:hypothetical protein